MTHDFGTFRITEIEAISDRDWISSGGGQIAPGFCDGLLAAFKRVGKAVSRCAIGGDGERLVGAVDTHDGGVGGIFRAGGGVCHHVAVILVPDPGLGGHVGAGHQAQQHIAHMGRLGDVLGADLGADFWCEMRAVIFGRIVSERCDRHVAHHFAVMVEHHTARVGGLADHRDVEFPFLEDARGHVFAAGLHDHQHSLLAFREHHFIGGHIGFALRNRVHIELDADATLIGHLDSG